MGRLSELFAGGTRREVATPFETGAEDFVVWLWDVHRVLVCGGDDAGDPMERCRLGGFIEALRPELGTEPAFRELVHCHALLHDRGEEILRISRRGAKVPRPLYDEFVQGSREALQCIVELEAASRELEGM